MGPGRLWCMAVALVAALWGSAAGAEGIAQQAIRIPATMTWGGAPVNVSFEAVVVRPDGPGRHPLVILNHGAPRDAAERPGMSPTGMVPQAREFARRGWVAVAFMRRGYGGTGGDYVESSGPCKQPDYVTSGKRGAEDIRAVIAHMVREPYVDGSRVLSVGRSAGGLATVALTADPPPGLVAAISFAGGRGSQREDEVCAEHELVAAFRTFGRTSRVPMLWVYSENDHFFGPRLARQFHEAFTAAGGKAAFIMADAFGTDGHSLFSNAGTPIWSAYVDRFLAERGLAPRARPMAQLAPPPGLSDKARAGFEEYMRASPGKAFATSPDGAWGWRGGRPSVQQAMTDALAACESHAKQACRLLMIDDARAP
ncbi:alpha/beta hydrolase family protein [Azospirillum sp.]|uniref:alpha/beta hydrolase family protein n=1 Tax=Azospirillum sp. TaxID=34012 RepID=UPI002D23B0E7|nr:dienelactone hydrolase family protein [Azospirillum sp.]HYD64671.1 dienelactone hydrolase family protein [Azospirillum sp.]